MVHSNTNTAHTRIPACPLPLTFRGSVPCPSLLAGAYYYYNVGTRTYTDVLMDVYNYSVKQGIPYKALLLDSWCVGQCWRDF